MPDLDTLGARLRAAREAAGMSLAQAGEALGCHLSQIHRWEQGRAEPRASAVAALARIYGVTTDRLLGMPSMRASASD